MQGSGFRVQGSGFRVQGSGFRIQGPGFRVQGSSGFGVYRGTSLVINRDPVGSYSGIMHRALRWP